MSQKLKDFFDADYFKNLSIFEEDNSDFESASFDEDRSADIGSEIASGKCWLSPNESPTGGPHLTCNISRWIASYI